MLADLDSLKSYLRTEGRVSEGAALPDGLLEQMLEAASDRIVKAAPDRTLEPTPRATEQDPDPAPVERRFPANRRVLQVPDLREVVALELDRDGVRSPVTAGYRLIKGHNDETALWLRFRHAVPSFDVGDDLVITGLWGPTVVAPSVREACIVWAARVFHQRAARFADSQGLPDGGVLGYFRNLPPDVKHVLEELQVPGL